MGIRVELRGDRLVHAPDATSRTSRARARGPRGFRLRRRGCASHHLSDDGERFVHRLVRGGGDGDVADGASQLPGWRRGDGAAPAAALGRVRSSRRVLAEPLRRVTERSSGFARAADAQSCESALGAEPASSTAARTRGVTCMTMLIRTENCQEWLRDIDGGDVFIDVSPALDAVRSAGQGGSPAPTQSPPRASARARARAGA